MFFPVISAPDRTMQTSASYVFPAECADHTGAQAVPAPCRSSIEMPCTEHRQGERPRGWEHPLLFLSLSLFLPYCVFTDDLLILFCSRLEE